MTGVQSRPFTVAISASFPAGSVYLPDTAIEEDGSTLERSTAGQDWITVAELKANP